MTSGIKNIIGKPCGKGVFLVRIFLRSDRIQIYILATFVISFAVYYLSREITLSSSIQIWGKAFKNGASKTCGRQPFTWSILEYFVPFIVQIYPKLTKN